MYIGSVLGNTAMLYPFCKTIQRNLHTRRKHISSIFINIIDRCHPFLKTGFSDLKFYQYLIKIFQIIRHYSPPFHSLSAFFRNLTDLLLLYHVFLTQCKEFRATTELFSVTAPSLLFQFFYYFFKCIVSGCVSFFPAQRFFFLCFSLFKC